MSASPIDPLLAVRGVKSVKIIKKMSAMNVDSMKTSPWAKFTMPMMPNTIV
jgi:hypothetical protein